MCLYNQVCHSLLPWQPSYPYEGSNSISLLLGLKIAAVNSSSVYWTTSLKKPAAIPFLYQSQAQVNGHRGWLTFPASFALRIFPACGIFDSENSIILGKLGWLITLSTLLDNYNHTLHCGHSTLWVTEYILSRKIIWRNAVWYYHAAHRKFSLCRQRG